VWLSSQQSTLERASVVRTTLAAPLEKVLPSIQKKVREKEIDPKVLRPSSWSQTKNDDQTLEKTARLTAKTNLEDLAKSFTTF
jgi:hypothetical protein